MNKNVSIQYQNAEIEDLSELLLLEDVSFSARQKYRKVLKRYFLSQTAHCIVAKMGERPVGYVLTVFSPNMKSATINALCVHPRMRENSIGENLLQWAEIEALQSGASQISAEVQLENAVMMHMMDQNGYQECSDSLVMLPAFSDGVKMRKRLLAGIHDSVQLTNHQEIEISALNADHFTILSR